MIPHIKSLAIGTLVLAAFAMASFAQTIASDNGANYGGVGEPGWTNDANAGFGFGPWIINNNNNGSSIFAGNFIGNPADAGISGMSTESFGLYANPAGSGAFINAFRPLNTALQVGETFSFQWGINWDGGNGSFGNKGFNLNVGATQVVNVNNGGTEVIDFNSINTGMGYGTQVMTWSFTYTNATTLLVSANDRDGVGTFTTNITVTGGVSSFELYASDMAGDTQRQPYFNDFQVVPEPSTYALLGLGAASILWRIRRRQVS